MPKALLVGAKTVNGPALWKVSTRPAAFTAATNVVWPLLLTAFYTIFFEGYMAAPPTITVFWLCAKDACVNKTAAATKKKNLELIHNSDFNFFNPDFVCQMKRVGFIFYFFLY